MPDESIEQVDDAIAVARVRLADAVGELEWRLRPGGRVRRRARIVALGVVAAALAFAARSARRRAAR